MANIARVSIYLRMNTSEECKKHPTTLNLVSLVHYDYRKVKHWQCQTSVLFNLTFHSFDLENSFTFAVILLKS